MDRGGVSESFEDSELFDVDIDTLRNEFRVLRKERRLSQSEVAKLLGVSQATISAYEHGSYDRVRKATLIGITKLVQFWNRDRAGIAQAPFAGNKIVSVPDHRGAYMLTPSQCPHCKLKLPEHDVPLPFCPFCKEPLGIVCECGEVIVDPKANLCSCCGRLVGEGHRVRTYPLLEKPRERRRMALLRSYLDWLDKGGGIDSLHEDEPTRSPEEQNP